MEETLSNPIPLIQRAKHDGTLFYSKHGLQQIIERDLTTSRIEEALNSAKAVVLENYPRETRPPSCLVLGWDDRGRPVHAVVAHPTVKVVTSYEPKPPKWIAPNRRGRT